MEKIVYNQFKKIQMNYKGLSKFEKYDLYKKMKHKGYTICHLDQNEQNFVQKHFRVSHRQWQSSGVITLAGNGSAAWRGAGLPALKPIRITNFK